MLQGGGELKLGACNTPSMPPCGDRRTWQVGDEDSAYAGTRLEAGDTVLEQLGKQHPVVA